MSTPLDPTWVKLNSVIIEAAERGDHKTETAGQEALIRHQQQLDRKVKPVEQGES